MKATPQKLDQIIKQVDNLESPKCDREFQVTNALHQAMTWLNTAKIIIKEHDDRVKRSA